MMWKSIGGYHHVFCCWIGFTVIDCAKLCIVFKWVHCAFNHLGEPNVILIMSGSTVIELFDGPNIILTLLDFYLWVLMARAHHVFYIISKLMVIHQVPKVIEDMLPQ